MKNNKTECTEFKCLTGILNQKDHKNFECVKQCSEPKIIKIIDSHQICEICPQFYYQGQCVEKCSDGMYG